jgi:hypothetical protein
VQDCGKLASAFCAIHLDKEVLELAIEAWGGQNLPIRMMEIAQEIQTFCVVNFPL